MITVSIRVAAEAAAAAVNANAGWVCELNSPDGDQTTARFGFWCDSTCYANASTNQPRPTIARAEQAELAL